MATQLGQALTALVDHLRTDAGASSWGGWFSRTTGYGSLNDKATSIEYARPADWTVDQLSDLYETDSIARRAVAAKVEDGLRQGYQILDAAGDASAGDEWVKRARAVFDWDDLTSRVLREARLYGGVLVIPMTPARDLEIPLPADGSLDIRSVQWVEPDGAAPHAWITDPASPRFQEPDRWQVQLRGLGGGSTWTAMIHSSRVLPVLSAHGTRRGRTTAARIYPHWPVSVLAPVLNGLRLYRSAMVAVNALIADASQGVYKVRGLSRMIRTGEDGAEDLRTWMWARDQIRSAINAIVLDAGSKDEPPEEFTRVATPMSELANLVDRFQALVSEVTGVPVTRLFGQAPAGLSTDDKSGTRNWNDQVQSWQTGEAAPVLLRLGRVLGRDPRVGPLPEGATIEWPSLWQYEPMEEAQARLTTAQADQIYLQAAVVQPEDVALTRVRPDGWRADLQFDEVALAEQNDAPRIQLAPTDVAKMIRVREARAASGLSPFGDARDEQTVDEYTKSLETQGEVAVAAAKEDPNAADPGPTPGAPPDPTAGA